MSAFIQMPDRACIVIYRTDCARKLDKLLKRNLLLSVKLFQQKRHRLKVNFIENIIRDVWLIVKANINSTILN